MALTLSAILNRLSPAARQKFITVGKRAFDLVWTEHSNNLMGARMIAHAKTLPTGQTKTRLNAVGLFVIAHPEMCYQDFIDYFNDVKGWYPDPDLMTEILNCFTDSPFVKKMAVKFLKTKYPNITEDKWL